MTEAQIRKVAVLFKNSGARSAMLMFCKQDMWSY